jgi:hypothetical protein
MEALHDAGKSVDKDVSRIFRNIVQESPTDRKLLELLLRYDAYDGGGSDVSRRDLSRC